ncbi:hypothetical protein PM082_006462 [Marasmius tenuissimus]|nr:hypothetical protein PM082_006462 [Marasmius tenuissimus]
MNISALRHHDYANPYQNHPLPGPSVNLPPTETLFGAFPSDTSATFRSEMTHGMDPNTYVGAGAPSFNAFPSSHSTIPHSNFTQPNVPTANLSMHAPQVTEWQGVPSLGMNANYHYPSLAPIPLNDFSVRSDIPPVGYPTNPGARGHGPYPAISQGYPSFTTHPGSGGSPLEQHWNVPVPQLEPRPVSPGPYADPSLYEQSTSGGEGREWNHGDAGRDGYQGWQ